MACGSEQGSLPCGSQGSDDDCQANCSPWKRNCTMLVAGSGHSRVKCGRGQGASIDSLGSSTLYSSEQGGWAFSPFCPHFILSRSLWRHAKLDGKFCILRPLLPVLSRLPPCLHPASDLLVKLGHCPVCSHGNLLQIQLFS